MPEKDRLSDSDVVRVDPDDAVVLSLVEVAELLLDGVLRIPSISHKGHHLDQRGRMTTHTDASSQTNNLTRGEDLPSETERRSLRMHQIVRFHGMTRTA